MESIEKQKKIKTSHNLSNPDEIPASIWMYIFSTLCVCIICNSF